MNTISLYKQVAKTLRLGNSPYRIYNFIEKILTSSPFLKLPPSIFQFYYKPVVII